MSQLKRVGTIRSIWRYPVKSMAGEQLASAELGWYGIDGDRRFAFTRTESMSSAPWLTASKLPELILYAARQVESKEGALPAVRVTMPDGLEVEVESASLRQHIIKQHGEDVAVIRVRNGIFDEFPISVITTTTIGHLEAITGRPLDARRFRPNLLIEPIDAGHVDERAWIGRTLVLGDRADAPSVLVTIRDVRCVMINLDPDTAVADHRIFRTIVRSEESRAGVYASVFRIGLIAGGDPVYIDESS